MASQSSRHIDRQGGYVYIMRCGDELKVGATMDINRRARNHKVKYSNIKLIAIIKAHKHMILERFLHENLKKFEVAKEWYKNEDDVLRKIITFLQDHGEIFGAYEIYFPAPKQENWLVSPA